MRLGLKPVVHDPRTLRLGAYLTPAMDDPPPECDWTPRVPDWLMYDNDRYGDCAYAAAAELIRVWTSNDEPYVTVTPDPAEVVREYFQASPQDQGIVLLDMMNQWRHAGLFGRRIAGFASVAARDHKQACLAVAQFGGLMLGMNLPLAVDPQHGLPDWKSPSLYHKWFRRPRAGGEWDPGSWGGHAVVAVKYDATGMWVVTWGGLKFMDWTFYDDYRMEGYVALSSDFLGKDGKAPNGLDVVALSRDLAKYPVAA